VYQQMAQLKQVCVEPRTSALNKTLPAAWVAADIDRYLGGVILEENKL